jgi:hypothetical protein
MSNEVTSPFTVFYDRAGQPLDAGYIYIGTAGINPEVSPISVYWDTSLTIPAAQPIRTLNGYASRNGSAANIFISQDTYSIVVKDKNGTLVYSNLNAFTTFNSVRYLQTNADLTALIPSSLADGSIYEVAGRAAAGDGGGGSWRYVAASVATANVGTVLAPDSGSGRFLRIVDNTGVLVTWFGIDTTAIDAANVVAQASATKLIFPPGNFTYGGTGLTGTTLELEGAGPQNTVIILTASKYLIDDPGVWGALSVIGIRTVGGAGAIRSTYTPAMVQAKMTIRDCEFRDYTGPCISNNSVDSPDWTIENNIFVGANGTTCIGIALSGLNDSCRIFGNSFRLNKVHLKLSEGGNNAYILANDFLRFEVGTARVDIWVVPDADGTNSGSGLWIGANKFGNENRATDGTEPCILYADQGAGTYFGDKLPSLVVSTGFISGHKTSGPTSYGNGGSPNTPFIRSYTPNVYGGLYSDITFGGTRPTYVIEWAAGATPTALVETSAALNVVGPIVCDRAAGDAIDFAYASSYNTVRTNNPAQAREVLNTTTSSVAAASIVYVGATGSNAATGQQVWRFPFIVQITGIYVYCITGAVGAGGTVTVTSILNAVPGTITGSFGGAGVFGGTFTGSDNLPAQQTLQVQLQTNASALAQPYTVMVEYRRVT